MKDIIITRFGSFFSPINYLPRWALLLLDIFISFICFLLSNAAGYGVFHYFDDPTLPPLWLQTIILLISQLIFFLSWRTYTGILRYSTFADIVKILFAVLCTGAVLLILNTTIYNIWDLKLFRNTTLFIYIFIASTILLSTRVFIKTIYETAQQHKAVNRVLIYGAKQSGIAIAKMLRSSGDAKYTPVGFIEDKKSEQINHTIVGLRVYELNESLFTRMKIKDIQYVIVSPMKLKSLNTSVDLQPFLNHQIHILTTPYFTDWEDDEVLQQNVGKIEQIRIEDLLDRPEIEINTENVRQILEGQTVLVTGAAGSIGSQIVEQVAKYKPMRIVLVEQAESPLHDLRLDLQQLYPKQEFVCLIGDIRSRQRMEDIFSEFRPQVVYHAAAYKHVPLMEEHPNEAIQTNVLGTKNVADMAVKYRCQRFVMISTDKAVNPTNVMGASKRIAEIYVQSLFKYLYQTDKDCTKFITTRFGNVLGSNGSVIPYFKKQIAMGGPVTVTHPDIIRYFMTIPEASQLVLEASTLGNGGEIFCFDMGQPVRIYDLAQNMIRLAGYRPFEDIQIVFTGLRPGEKLYEELLNKKETTLPTPNKKILIAKVREMPYETILEQIVSLIAISKQNKPYLTVEQMKHIVPEYKSRNSVYEMLDK
ncbi:MAG: polysaccharide biosynthesis protein [Paludibacteraceae bacterium]|nr:polysaccharide biosynthesis protein [Paludibacteraceae bacterium]